MERVFIFGGSFDPIHLGHLILAQNCAETLNARVVFLPTGNPPHKTIKTEALHRLNMLKVAVKDNPIFDISTFELEKKEVSYTYKTLEYLHSLYKKDLFFFVGGDSMLDIHQWKNPEKILQKSILIYAKRLGYDLQVAEHFKKHNLNPDRVMELETPVMEISSTQIRNYLKEGKSIKYLVPHEVERYIMKNKLYM